MADWHVGMKVVCVRTGNPRGGPFVAGGVYTIRSICAFPHLDDGLIGLRFMEVFDKDTHSDGSECCWHPDYFRPVRETKTDISIFRKLVEPSELAKVRESVDG